TRFNKASVFFDFLAPAAGQTYWFDDVKFLNAVVTGGGGGSVTEPEVPAWLDLNEDSSPDGVFIKPAADSGVASLKFQALWSASEDSMGLPVPGPVFNFSPDSVSGFIADDLFDQAVASITRAGISIGDNQTARPTVAGVRVIGLDSQGAAIDGKSFDFVDALSFNRADGLDSRGIRVYDEDRVSRNPFSTSAGRGIAFSDSDGHGNPLVYVQGTSSQPLTDQVAVTLPAALAQPGALNGFELRADIVDGEKVGDRLMLGNSNLFSVDTTTGVVSFLPGARYAPYTGSFIATPTDGAFVIGQFLVDGKGAEGQPLKIKLNAEATPEHLDLLAAALVFSTSLSPSLMSSQAWDDQAGQREIAVSIHDPQGNEIGWDSRTLEFVSLNDAPFINGPSASHAGFNALASTWVAGHWDIVGSGIARVGWRTGSWAVRDGDTDSGYLDLSPNGGFDVAVVGATGAGKWYYWGNLEAMPQQSNMNGVTGWTLISNVSETAALLLDANTPVRFVPDVEGMVGEPALQLRAWDGTGKHDNGTPYAHGNTVNVGAALQSVMTASGASGPGLVFYGNAPQEYEYVRIWRDGTGADEDGKYTPNTTDISYAVFTRPADATSSGWGWRTPNPIAALDSASDLQGIKVAGLNAADVAVNATPPALSSSVTIESSAGVPWSVANLTIPFSPNSVNAEMPVPFLEAEAITGGNTISIMFAENIATTNFSGLSGLFTVAIDSNGSDMLYDFAPVASNAISVSRHPAYADELLITLSDVTLDANDLIRIGYQPSTTQALQLSTGAAIPFEEFLLSTFTSGGGTGGTSPIQGKVVDGYVSGATVFIDFDNDGIHDPDEPSVSSMADGSFTLPAGQGMIRTFLGTDTATGKTLIGGYMAPQGYTTITPLTTMLAAYLGATTTVGSPVYESTMTRALALEDISAVTGISAALLTQDVFGQAATNAAAFAAQQYAAQVANVIEVAMALYDGDVLLGPDPAVVQGLAVGASGRILMALDANGTLDLANTATLGAILTAASVGSTFAQPSPTEFQAIVDALSQVNAAIDSVDPSSGLTGLEQVVRLQSVLQGEIVPDVLSATPFDGAPYTASGIQALAASQTIGVLPGGGSGGGQGSNLATEDDDSLSGDTGNNSLSGLGGDDELFGFDGNDTLSGGSGDDSLFGGAGNDTATDLAAGDLFIGGQGVDVAVFAGSASDYTVSLASAEQRAMLQGFTGAQFGYEPGGPVFVVASVSNPDGITVIQAEKIQFGNDVSGAVAPLSLVDELIVGSWGTHTTLPEAINAAQVGDRIIVLADYSPAAPEILVTKDDLEIVLEGYGSPILFRLAEAPVGGSVSVFDLVLGGTRDADVIGNSAANIIVGNDGRNYVDGLGGSDTLIGSGGDDDLVGGTGDDWLDGGDGWDILRGGSGDDRLFADGGGVPGTGSGIERADLLAGGSGDDLLMVAGGDGSLVRMLGGSGNDLFRIANFDDGSDDEGVLRPADEARPFKLNAFIADLTDGDGIDLSLLRPDATGTSMPAGFFAGSAVSGDLPIEFGPNADNEVMIIGLTPGASPNALPSLDYQGRREDVLGSLRVALADSESVNAAIDRGSDTASAFLQAHAFDSIQTLLTEVGPVYQALI
ncbi:MAG: hypothetical protein RL322_1492, partial [Pseudomonadota bacterium]